MGKKVHLINEVGHRIEVESCAIADDELLNENKYSNYEKVRTPVTVSSLLVHDSLFWVKSHAVRMPW